MAMVDALQNYFLNGLLMGLSFGGLTQAQTIHHAPMTETTIKAPNRSMIYITADMVDGDTIEYNNGWRGIQSGTIDGFARNGFSILQIGNGYHKPENFERQLDSSLHVMETNEGRYFLMLDAHGSVNEGGYHQISLGTYRADSMMRSTDAETFSFLRPVMDTAIARNMPLDLILDSCHGDKFLSEMEDRYQNGFPSLPAGSHIVTSAQIDDISFGSTTRDAVQIARNGSLKLGDMIYYSHMVNSEQRNDENADYKFHRSPSGSSVMIFKPDGSRVVVSARKSIKDRLGFGLSSEEQQMIVDNYVLRAQGDGSGYKRQCQTIAERVSEVSTIMQQAAGYDTMPRRDLLQCLRYVSYLQEEHPAAAMKDFLEAEAVQHKIDNAAKAQFKTDAPPR